MTEAEAQRLHEENAAAIQAADAERERIRQTLAESRRVRRTAIPKLRRAGLLR